MNPRVLAAELFGTFGLTLAVMISINNPGFPISTPVIAGLAMGTFVYTIGSISGCHINPAVTVGLASIGKIDIPSAAAYIVSQFVGAVIALAIGNAIFAAPVELVAGGSVGIGLAELLGALLFLFGIAAVVLGRVPEAMSGVVIGSSLTLGVHFAAHTSNGVLNPAVALGIGSFSAPYVWGPVVGAALGAWISSLLAGRKRG
jgi:aquaporin Z